jgi:hypothetical protein
LGLLADLGYDADRLTVERSKIELFDKVQVACDARPALGDR